LIVDSADAPATLKALRAAFANDLVHHDVDHITVNSHIAIVAIVGDKMRGAPGIAGRTFSALGRSGVNIIAIAQGSSEYNISFVVEADAMRDALEVQRQIAEVRTEIERLEGRKRFIENRSSLATITVNIQAPKPAIATTPTGFGHSLREAISESVELGSGMVIFFVRFLIVMFPVLLFVGLPSALVLRYFVRRARRVRLAEALATPAGE